MQETSFNWSDLLPNEKALCLNYRRLLIGNRTISNSLIIEINSIHLKHPGFDMGMVPDGTEGIPAKSTIEDLEVIQAYLDFKAKGVSEDSIFGLTVLAKKLMATNPDYESELYLLNINRGNKEESV